MEEAERRGEEEQRKMFCEESRQLLLVFLPDYFSRLDYRWSRLSHQQVEKNNLSKTIRIKGQICC